MYQLDEQLRLELRQELNELFDRRFTHRDYLALNRKWKGIAIDQMSSIILGIIELEIERYIQESEQKSCQ